MEIHREARTSVIPAAQQCHHGQVLSVFSTPSWCVGFCPEALCLVVARGLPQLQTEPRSKTEKTKKGEKKCASNICPVLSGKLKQSQKQPPSPSHSTILLKFYWPELGFITTFHHRGGWENAVKH